MLRTSSRSATLQSTTREFSEAAYRAVVELLRDGVVVHADGRIVFANHAASRLIGAQSPQELLGRSALAFVHPDDLALAEQRLQRIAAGAAVSEPVEERLVKLDGSVIDVEITSMAIDYGARCAIQVIIRDISKSKQREQAVRESEEKFRKMIEAASDPVSVSVFDTGEYLEVNQSWCDFTGLRREQVIGRSYADLGQWANKEDILRYAKALRRGERSSPDVQLRKANGEIRIGSLSGALIQIGGRTMVLTWIRDVTERKRAEEALRESEERFRSLAAFAPIGIFRTDVAGRSLYSNPRWLQMAGLSLEQSLGEGWAAAIHPEDRERVRQEWERCTREVTDFDSEFRFQAAQGEVRWVRTIGAALRSPSGEVLGYVGTNQDISEGKAIEQMRSDVVRMLSHDLKNPLAGILGFTDILREELRVGRGPGEAMDAIESSARQAMMLALNFLEVDRIDSGALQIHTAPTSLNEIVKHVVRQQEPRARLSKVELRADLDASLPSLDLDTALVDRVVTNLLSNAIKFSAPGTTVHVETRRQESQAVLEVRDNGPGITAEDRKSLFRRYGRGSTARPESTGLGLFIVKIVVEAHGGSVDVHCPPDSGSVFECRFPIAHGGGAPLP